MVCQITESWMSADINECIGGVDNCSSDGVQPSWNFLFVCIAVDTCTVEGTVCTGKTLQS